MPRFLLHHDGHARIAQSVGTKDNDDTISNLQFIFWLSSLVGLFSRQRPSLSTRPSTVATCLFCSTGQWRLEREPRTHITALRNSANDSLHLLHVITEAYSSLSFSAIFPGRRFGKRAARWPTAPDVENIKGQNDP